MDRRNFVGNSAFALLFEALRGANSGVVDAYAYPTPQAGGATTLQLTKLNNPNAVAPLYIPGAKAVGPPPSPYVYAYFDEGAKKFLNPLATEPSGVKPALDKGSYSVTPTLQAFNIQKAKQTQFKNLKNQIQLGFNATAPISESEQLTWVFMSAIDIFLAKDSQGRQDQLTKFTSSQNAGTSLTSNPKISVANGVLSLQITAFGQKQDSFWTKFFDVVAKITNSPIVSSALKGFGVPGLVSEAVTFVDGVMDTIAQQNKLIPLWQTGGLQFAVTKDASARFNMKEGLWAIVDSDYAQQTNFLEGHSVDLTYQSFRLFDKNSKAVDANYLVTNIAFAKS
jgi:hypothetical protein